MEKLVEDSNELDSFSLWLEKEEEEVNPVAWLSPSGLPQEAISAAKAIIDVVTNIFFMAVLLPISRGAPHAFLTYVVIIPIIIGRADIFRKQLS